MALSTYTELKTSIGDWLNRSDLTSVIPDFISLAEAQVERTLRTRQMIVRANASFDAEYGAVPSDFLETKSLKLTSTNPQTPLEFLSIDALDNKAAEYTGSGKPRFFGVVGGQFRLVPVPDTSVPPPVSLGAAVKRPMYQAVGRVALLVVSSQVKTRFSV